MKGGSCNGELCLIPMRQAICGGYNALAHAEIVPSAANNDQFATRPTLRELPRRDKWCTDIQSTVKKRQGFPPIGRTRRFETAVSDPLSVVQRSTR